MSITWRMKIYDATFTSRTQPGKVDNVLTPADAIASLDAFDVEGSGNCLEARFRAVPDLVDIQPRDVITLEVSDDGGSTYTMVYRGYIVTAGNPRSKTLEPYKAVGLKQRFYEKANPLERIDGADVATMANNLHSGLITASELPAGVSTGAIDAPTLNFVVGNRYPQYEDAGVTYDFLADQVGSFIVPSGTTYVYDGVTYSGGENVPPVRWGVDAAGNFFFRRWQRAALTGSEADENTVVRYSEQGAESVVNQVGVIYASQLDLGPFDNVRYIRIGTNPVPDASGGDAPLGQPLLRKFSFGGDDSTELVAAADPVGLCVMISDYTSGDTTGTVTNPQNVADGDIGTVASITNGSVWVRGDSGIYQNDGFIGRIRFTVTSVTNSVAVMSSGTGAIFVFDKRLQYEATNLPDNATYDLYLPFLPGVNTSEFSGGVFTDSTWPINRALRVVAQNIDVALLEIYVPDVDDGGVLSEEYANVFVRQPSANVAQVSQYGSLGGVSQTMTFTPAGESAIDVPVERIEYTLTTREGLVTTYHLGQAYDAELLSERAVLEALAQRATR